MIDAIVIASEANFDEAGHHLNNLKPVNFVYGANGTGKTTVSRVLANPGDFKDCSIRWSDQTQQQCLVYNRQFIRENFAEKMRGVFTLGEEDVTTMDTIEKLKKEVDALNESISSKKLSLCGDNGNGGKTGELAKVREKLNKDTWSYQQKYNEDFEQAFKGDRGSKRRFTDRLLKEFEKENKTQCPSLEELKTRATTIFVDNPSSLRKIDEVGFTALDSLESNIILEKKIVGADDIDLAPLIEELNNSDWVKQGTQYLEVRDNICPFCQQSVDDSLRQKLHKYFDEAYLKDLVEIKSLTTDYKKSTALVIKKLLALTNTDIQYLNREKISDLANQFEDRVLRNIDHWDTKYKEPSRSISLESTAEISSKISELIEEANNNINDHNTLFKNARKAHETLTKDVWQFVVGEASPILSTYISQKTDLDKAIEGLKAGINSKSLELEQKLQALKQLEKKITSVQPTVDEINQLLRSFGFENFYLRTTGQENELYEIVRPDGTSAAETLSEGEKSFITFLYFYQLIRGSMSQSGLIEDRIIVIDDPVSSLDSDVLFVVSSLIKQLIKEACEGTGEIKQVFILTHNIYFHKEVSYDPKRGDACRNHETFWIIRKSHETSIIEGFNRNPIKTSYELLWQSLRESHYSNLTIQNTLRRILENYFKILGDVDFNEIVEKFEGKDKQVCGSLFSWVHDGSHNALDDDLYLSTDQSIIYRYLQVFKQIFTKLGQKPHYDMMMRHASNSSDDTLEDKTT